MLVTDNEYPKYWRYKVTDGYDVGWYSVSRAGARPLYLTCGGPTGRSQPSAIYGSEQQLDRQSLLRRVTVQGQPLSV